MFQKDDRYSRQWVLPEIGKDGQRRIQASSVLIVGCGALGSAQAELLARAGVGRLRLADRDIVEENNLQRQMLYDEKDVAARLPKTEAAVRRLQEINSSIDIEGLVIDVGPRNIEKLVADTVLVMDGTDNFEIRYLINDVCVKYEKPWIYGGVIGTSGMSMTVVPGAGPCLRCLQPNPPPPGSLPTCDTSGVLNAATVAIACLQVTAALKVLTGSESVDHKLRVFDLWTGDFQTLTSSRIPECPACGQRRFDFLSAEEVSWTTTLCGRNSVQISPRGKFEVPLSELQARLENAGETRYNGLLLQFKVGEYEMVIFRDGRTIVRGTTDEALARSLYAKYLGG